MISPNVDVIGRMKIQNVKFSPKNWHVKFHAHLTGNVWYMYVKRRKARVLVTPVLTP